MNLKNQIMAKYLNNKQIFFSFFILLTIILISSCGFTKEKKEIPEGLIPKNEFVDIMVDVRMVETSIRQKISRGNNAVKSTDYYYSYIFKKYNITAEQFNISLKYYSTDIKEMQDINVQVVERLTQMESEVKAQKKVE